MSLATSWRVLLSPAQLARVGAAAYGDALEVVVLDDDAGISEQQRYLCCAWPILHLVRGEGDQAAGSRVDADLSFQLRASAAERAGATDCSEPLFVLSNGRRVRIRAPAAWSSPPPPAREVWLRFDVATDRQQRRKLLLRLRAALGGRLVCSGGSFDFECGMRRPCTATVVRVLGSSGAALPVARASARTHLHIIEEADAASQPQPPPAAAAADAVAAARGGVFPTQRRAFDALCDLLRASMAPQAEALRAWGVRPPSGLLLSGPPGTGKTHVVRCAARAYGAPLVAFSGAADGGSLVASGASDETAEAVEELTAAASKSVSSDDEMGLRLHAAFGLAEAIAQRESAARGRAVSAVLLLDEIDALCPKRSAVGNGAEQNRTVAVALTMLDGLRSRHGLVLAVGATNRPHAIDEALRRPGRLE